MSRTALLLVNLGTPAGPTSTDVRRFLRAFLSDRRVVNVPRLVWFPVLYGIILPMRAPRVAELYKKIWWPEGSPLRVITQRQTEKLSARFACQVPAHAVRFAMVYGQPSIAGVVDDLMAEGVENIVVLPLYPQFCSATTGSVCDQLNALRKRLKGKIRLELVKSYHDDPEYINALAMSVSRHWQEKQRATKLLFSFHGIPQALADSGDPYYQQCHETAALVARCLQLDHTQWQVTFQSRFGRAEWVKPYTDHIIVELAAQGVKSIDIITPAFASDCLETLEEIAIQHAELFVHHGGEQLRLIPCLNDSDAHIDMMAKLFEKKCVL